MDSIPISVSEIYSKAEADKRLISLEEQELDSPLGLLTAELYTEFLGLYLLTNDNINAKLLWKRIPENIKLGHNELSAVWEIGKSAWKHNYSDLHEKLKVFTWSEAVQRILTQYKHNVTEHCFNLVTDGYTSIKLRYLASMLGMTEADTIAEVKKRNWIYIADNAIVKPVKTAKTTDYTFKNEEHLEKLTRHILFLET